ncbi:hypothetical protein BJX68DRAFT_272899 [Aspergillus pseudodeflectus]|uniref:FAD-binding domain-containing protein n=1 Tax=Aspergillus pseudodeflectus TaxID=176178 RepID=A0ABR4JCX4_9EURO
MGSLAENHHKVIVVGAGPVGVTAAINLARLGVKPLILERNAAIDQSPRATSYQACVLAEMMETGIYEDLRRQAVVNDALSFWVSEGSQKKRIAQVHKKEGGDHFPQGLNCGQPTLTTIILDHLITHYDAQVLFRQKVTNLTQTGALVTITCTDPATGEPSVYTCDWLIGADGAGSTVRKLLDIEFEGFSWPKEDFVATNLVYPFDKYGFSTANFLVDPVHWAVITVIDGKLWRCAFGVKPGMDNERIRAELDEHFRHILPGWEEEGGKYELVQLNRYKPHQRCASQYRKGRCLLAGDAAHSNNPVGGLGLTTGLLDAGPLGRALGAVISGRAPESILDTWAEARRDKWLTFTNAFSIENKRMIQKGGHGVDPLGIWELDDVAKQHRMERWISTATSAMISADAAFFRSLDDPASQLKSRMRQWAITMDPLWMAEYEDKDIVDRRMALRPPNDAIAAALA